MGTSPRDHKALPASRASQLQNSELEVSVIEASQKLFVNDNILKPSIGTTLSQTGRQIDIAAREQNSIHLATQDLK